MEQDDKLLACPLTYANGSARRCLKNECAWWVPYEVVCDDKMVDEGSCALATLAHTLYDMDARMEGYGG
jgi:hypothetical protein